MWREKRQFADCLESNPGSRIAKVTAAENLKRVPLFSDLDGRQLKKLAGLFRERTFQPGTSIVREGTASGVGFFVITAGEAKVHVNGRDVATLSAGDHFGEIALVSEDERTATVTARTELRCLEIPFWDFRDFALKNPDVTWKLLQHVVEVLSAETASAPE
jgi:CRP/FNR family cyclic AMP-dependent transcriptional regulator